MSSGGIVPKSSARPPLAEKPSRPLNSERTKLKPRMILLPPSDDGKSPLFWSVRSKRCETTPGTRERASATERSGKVETSDAVIESTAVSAARFKSRASFRA